MPENADMLDQLRLQFDRRYLERGIACQRAGRVGRVTLAPDGKAISALVQGASAGRPYRCYVRILGSGTHRTFDGECSCSVGYNCKHVAAALLHWVADEPAAPCATPPPVTVRDRYPAGVTERIVYVLRISERGRVGLEPVVCRLLASGGYGVAKAFNPSSGLATHRARFVLDSDADMMRALQRFAGKSLSAETGTAVLRAAIATGRCHPRSPGNPALSERAARRLDMAWDIDGNGIQHLAARGAPDDLVWLDLTPPWYVCVEQGECGPLLDKRGMAPPRALLAMGPVPASRSAEIREQLIADGAAEWPLPRILPVSRVPDRPPVPLLWLDSEALGEQTRECARLAFDYGHRVIAPDEAGDEIHVVKDAVVYTSRRDRTAERAAHRRLIEAGLAPVDALPDLSRGAATDWQSPSGEPGWLAFMTRGLAWLEGAAGFQVRMGQRFRYAIEEVGPLTGRVREDQDWFSLELGVEAESGYISVLPLIARMLDRYPDLDTMPAGPVVIDLPDGRLIRMDAGRVATIVRVLLELGGARLSAGGALRLPGFACSRLAELEHELGAGLAAWRGGEDLLQRGRRLLAYSGPRALPAPPGLRATLRHYQSEGLGWLQFLREFGLGGILADDMGLGKTVQTLAHLLVEYNAGRLTRPVLVVAPTSVAGNWLREAERFAPELKLVALYGARRHTLFGRVDNAHLVITTYALLARDADYLLHRTYHAVVLDEAQTIKNASSMKAGVARELRAQHRICLTGTPMENHLGELWSLFEFLMPGFLGAKSAFNRLFRRPIEREGDDARRGALARRIGPFLLRRSKQQVAAELPPKSEIEQIVSLTGAQRDLYETIRVASQRQVRDLLASKGLDRSRIEVLDALLKLRQVCCDPRLVKLDAARGSPGSAKLDLLMDMLPELVEEGRRILIFSQFTQMLALVGEALDKAGIPWLKLTGQTRDRERVVDGFQRGDAPVFLLSLKAGGVGLNLTAADTVIHYDPWWNPAVERQATDRAHRIGQARPVFVYKLLVNDSVETHIQVLQRYKAGLADALFGDAVAAHGGLSDADLDTLFKPMETLT